MYRNLQRAEMCATRSLLHLPFSVVNKSTAVDSQVSDCCKIPREKSSELTCTERSYSNVHFDETSYYFQNGFRRVYPYYYTHRTFCKERWIGKNVVDVLCSEFIIASQKVCEERIARGELKVNGLPIPDGYRLKNADCITSEVHRHEMPVLAAPVKIVTNDDEIVVVDKPPSLPVHPISVFRHNSLLFILAREHSLKSLYVSHRLDRLTSGILLLPKTKKKAEELYIAMVSRKIQKEYVCRVEGRFPDGIVTCCKPLKVIKYKISISYVGNSGRTSITEFERISYNGRSSVVICRPLTGRTHQIRVHLQYLGYPIANDPIYNSHHFGPTKGKGANYGRPMGHILNDVLKSIITGPVDIQKNVLPMDPFQTLIMEYYQNTAEYCELSKQYVLDESKLNLDSNCNYCKSGYFDPVPRDLFIFLHAVRYKSDNWDYSTEMPDWAKSDWNVM